MGKQRGIVMRKSSSARSLTSALWMSKPQSGYRIYADSGYEKRTARKCDAERLARARSMRKPVGLAVYVLNDRTGYWSKHVGGIRTIIS